MGHRATIILFLLSAIAVPAQELSPVESTNCPPTVSAITGPLFAFEVPERSSVGEGHILRGIVKSSRLCSAISNAKLEFWLTNDEGRYDENHRAALFTDEFGAYSFKSNFPVPFNDLSPQIYVRASAKGYQTIVAVFEPEQNQREGTFDIVLSPLDNSSN